MLKLIDIKKIYKVEEEVTVALGGVSIEFRQNEFVSILGPSGCGKTTLLNIVGGLDRYTSGDIQIEGVSTKDYDDVDWDTYRNRRVGFVFQSYNLIPHLNILKNVAMSLTLAGVERDERRRRALEALKLVGLESQAKKRPNQLSGGQMQRVAIARALVNNPEIILADEPTGALDTESGIQVMDLLKEVAKDRLVIMVTHNPQLAKKYSTRIVYLKDGMIVGDTKPYNPSGDLPSNDAAAAPEAQEIKPVEPIKNCVESGDKSMSTVYGKPHGGVDDLDDDEDVGLMAPKPKKEIDKPHKAHKADKANKEDKTEEVENSEPVASEQAPAVEQGEDTSGDNGEKHGLLSMFKAGGKRLSFKERRAKRKSMNRSAMKLSTAISLSWNNLISKKGRTFLTSVAGSIGIIGIILVLALSNGATNYIDSLEENALSSYPISIEKSSMDIGSLMTTLMGAAGDRTGSPDDETIKVQEVLGKMISEVLGSLLTSENDLHSFKLYADKYFDNDIATVKYDYGVAFNAYTRDKNNSERYMKINPYTETMGTVFSDVLDRMPELGDLKFNIMGQSMGLQDGMGMIATYLGSAWSEISRNQKLVEKQYDLVSSKSRWPVAPNEAVIVVDSKNRIMDFELFMLGLQSQDEVFDALINGAEFSAKEYDIDDLLNLEYKIMTNADYMEENSDEPGTYIMHPRTEQSVDWVDEHAVKFADGSDTVKIVGVVRPKPNSVASTISGLIGYPASMTDYLLGHCENSPAVKALQASYKEAKDNGYTGYDSPITYYANPDGTPQESGSLTSSGVDIEIGDGVMLDDKVHDEILRQLGYVDVDYPTSIRFYCSSFDSKDAVIAFIDEYNDYYSGDPSKQIKYSDSLSTMMSFVDTMATTITGVLVAFAAISLIVSTIMIAIIIYTSVLERRKEIGVLRSIGARKKDISRVFIAESAILGGYSGVIGVAVSFGLSVLISMLLKTLFGISGLMTVKWWHCLLMLAISVLLSILAGFVPSRIAANKDPAIALRSE